MWGGMTSAAEPRVIADVQDIVHGDSVTCLLHNSAVNPAVWRTAALDEGSACSVPIWLEGQRIIFAAGA